MSNPFSILIQLLKYPSPKTENEKLNTTINDIKIFALL